MKVVDVLEQVGIVLGMVVVADGETQIRCRECEGGEDAELQGVYYLTEAVANGMGGRNCSRCHRPLMSVAMDRPRLRVVKG